MPSATTNQRVVVVGSGPGGLTAAMILARRGFDVVVCEKLSEVGGRSREMRLGPYRHDVGPTFLMMKFVLDEVFRLAGREGSSYLEYVRLDPMYELMHSEFTLRSSDDSAAMRAEIERVFPGQGAGFDRFLKRERLRFERIYPALRKEFSRLRTMLHPDMLRALPHVALSRSLYGVLSDYFEPEQLRVSFTFQSKYLGMSPWTCPGVFAMIPYAEYGQGVWHVTGGLNRISHAMAKIVEEHGGTVRCSSGVKRVLVNGRTATGVELEDGERIEAGAVVINADFAHAATTLFDPGVLRKYTPDHMRTREYSCSTFMLYLGLDTIYKDVEHHRIVFARDYRANLEAVTATGELPDDFSFYIRNASTTDATLAPPGHSAVYILVPAPNLLVSEIDWPARAAEIREKVLDAVETRGGMPGLRSHIVEEATITPADWQDANGVYAGATFNLSHKLSQMLYLRPHNRFEEVRRCYLVGGGTHPGSGLPTIYESGRIAAELIGGGL